MSHITAIPPGVLNTAISAISAMSERPTFQPKRLTSTCKQVAETVCRKMEVTDIKMIRRLTNMLVTFQLNVDEVHKCDEQHKFVETTNV